MYGYVEKQLAVALGVEYWSFTLNDGAEAAMVDKDVYDKIYNALSPVCLYLGLHSPIASVNSDISGMKIMLHAFYYDHRVLDGLTSGETKATDIYRNIISMGRINTALFVDALAREWRAINNANAVETELPNVSPTASATQSSPELDINVSPTDVGEVLNQEKVDIVKQPSDMDRLREEIGNAVRNNVSLSSPDSGLELDYNVYYIGPCDGYVSNESASRFANLIKKDIYLVSNIIYLKMFLSPIKNKLKNIKEFEEKTIILVKNREDIDLFFIPKADMASLCLGSVINKIGVAVSAGANNEINKLKREYSGEELRVKVEQIIKSKSNSCYSRFDEIYKDSITNVVWAVREKNIIYFTPLAVSQTVYDKFLDVLSRRIGKNLSKEELSEIDKEYNKTFVQNNKIDYIDFILKNSNSLIETIKEQYNALKLKYQKLWDELLETGKVMHSLLQQIDSFNEGKYLSEQSNKAEQSYNDTIGLNKVSAIFVEDKLINVYTKNIYVKDDRTSKWHDVGAFHIKIGMASKEYDIKNTIKIKNIKYQITDAFETGMEAPHVFSSGYLCHGNAEMGIADAYIKRDLYRLIFQIITFLSTANTDDAAGKYIDRWPQVSEEEATSEKEFEYEKQISPEEKRFDADLENYL
jgi:hypothetical protein